MCTMASDFSGFHKRNSVQSFFQQLVYADSHAICHFRSIQVQTDLISALKVRETSIFIVGIIVLHGGGILIVVWTHKTLQQRNRPEIQRLQRQLAPPTASRFRVHHQGADFDLNVCVAESVPYSWKINSYLVIGAGLPRWFPHKFLSISPVCRPGKCTALCG